MITHPLGEKALSLVEQFPLDYWKTMHSGHTVEFPGIRAEGEAFSFLAGRTATTDDSLFYLSMECKTCGQSYSEFLLMVARTKPAGGIS